MQIDFVRVFLVAVLGYSRGNAAALRHFGGVTMLGSFLLASGCAPATGQRMSPSPTTARQVVNPPGIAPLVAAYSVAIRAGDHLFVSGLTGSRPGTQDIVDGGIGPQTRQTLENIRTVLAAAGATSNPQTSPAARYRARDISARSSGSIWGW